MPFVRSDVKRKNDPGEIQPSDRRCKRDLEREGAERLGFLTRLMILTATPESEGLANEVEPVVLC